MKCNEEENKYIFTFNCNFFVFYNTHFAWDVGGKQKEANRT